MDNNTTKDSGQEVQKEDDLLSDLLSKINLEPPKKGIKNLTDVDEAESNQLVSTAINHFIRVFAEQNKEDVGTDKLELNMKVVDDIIENIDQKLSLQLSEYMHHEKVQNLESAWKGLEFLVKRTNFSQNNIHVHVLDVSKEDLRSELDFAVDLTQTGLYHHLYQTEYDQAGGEPYGAVIANYYYGNRSDDLGMLNKMAKIGSAAHTPVITAASSDMFGIEDATRFHEIKSLEAQMSQKEYIKYRGLRESEDSRYLGLCFPRFLLREPYSPENYTSRDFSFTEHVGDNHENFLWGNASLAFATRLTECFEKNGWCVNIRGPEAGGRVDDLPIYTYKDRGETTYKVPTEVMISDRMELELANSGFIPLTYYKERDYACFFSAQSVQKPQKYTTDEATANAKLSANLPYLFLTSRLAHYLKVHQRENIGSNKEAREIQNEMDEWIKRLVTNMPNPGPELLAKRPLKEANIEVEEIPDSPGYYRMKMFIRPHIQLEGIDASLSLVSKIPGKDKK